MMPELLSANLNRSHLRVMIAGEVALLVALAAWAVSTGGDGAQLGLIPTLIAITAKKFFGKKSDADVAFGEHPAVEFIFKALATGDMDDADELVDADFHAYANGYAVVDPTDGNGVALFKENIEYWRTTVPDFKVDIYDEVSQKDPDKTDSIAVRYVITGTLASNDDGNTFETEAAAFVKVVDKKILEWRVVVDEAFFSDLRSAMGL